MKESNGITNVLKWVGVAVIAAIPIYLLVKKVAEQSEGMLVDTADIFSEELSG